MTAGMIDLGAMLRTLRVTRRPETYTFITLDTDAPALGDGVEAVISEAEGPTVVATLQRALAEGWPIGFTATWLTLDIHSALEAVGLTGRDNARAHQLSGGEARRAGIARLMLAQPRLVVADELTAGLDAPLSEQTCSMLSSCSRQAGSGS